MQLRGFEAQQESETPIATEHVNVRKLMLSLN